MRVVRLVGGGQEVGNLFRMGMRTEIQPEIWAKQCAVDQKKNKSFVTSVFEVLAKAEEEQEEAAATTRWIYIDEVIEFKPTDLGGG